MIWVLINKDSESNINKQIIEWVRSNFQKNNIHYRLKFCRDYMFETDINDIRNDDYIFWNPFLASKNLDIVKRFRKSIIILERETLLSEKINSLNPINENLAVNYGFYLMYLNETDKFSKEWKLAVHADDYLMRQKNIIKLIMSDRNNFRTTYIERPDLIDNKENIITQINCDE